MPLLPRYLVIITIAFVILPSLITICLRFAVHKHLVFLENRVRRLINRGDRGNQPEIVNELEKRFKEASCNLEQVNTAALIDQVYSQEKVWFLSCEQIDYFCRTLPNLLLSFGLLGTFLGITLNLSELSKIISQNSTTDVSSLVSNLQKPLEGMGIAFTASLAGIFFSALLTVVNLLKNTSIAKYKLISAIEDYLDNIYLPKVQGSNRMDEAVNRLVFEFQDFLGRFGTTVRDAVEASLGAKIQQIVDVNKQSSDLARQVYNGFQESSGTIARSASDLQIAGDRFTEVAQIFEQSQFARLLSNATKDLFSIQKSFSNSASVLAESVSSIKVAVIELHNSSQKIVNLAEEISSINQTSIQVLELHQNSQQSLGAIIPQLKQGAQSFQSAVTTLDSLQRQIVDEPDTLSDVQIELIKLVDTLKQHTEQVNLGIQTLGDRFIKSHKYQSYVLVEKLQEGINHFSDKKLELSTPKQAQVSTQAQVQNKQVNPDKLNGSNSNISSNKLNIK